jgi:hypothetical protein
MAAVVSCVPLMVALDVPEAEAEAEVAAEEQEFETEVEEELEALEQARAQEQARADAQAQARALARQARHRAGMNKLGLYVARLFQPKDNEEESGFTKFVVRLVKYSELQMTPQPSDTWDSGLQVLAGALVLLEPLKEQGRKVDMSPMALLWAGATLALKFLTDYHVDMDYMAQVGCVSLSEGNKLELQLLHELKFCAAIDPTRHANFMRVLRLAFHRRRAASDEH